MNQNVSINLTSGLRINARPSGSREGRREVKRDRAISDLWRPLGALLGHFGPLWDVLGTSWEAFGAPLGAFGGLWEPLGLFLDVFGRFLAPSRGDFGAEKCAKCKFSESYCFVRENHIFRGSGWSRGRQNGTKRCKNGEEEHKSVKKCTQ